MTHTRTICPRCRQPFLAEIDQLFDVNTNPEAKQRFLSGQFNLVHCPSCGYEGQSNSPIVYHDPNKELLLTYFPPDLGLPLNEQERLIGPMINQVTKDLPMDKRKGYLLRPQAVLTLQGLIERVLEGEGITHEMIQAQQQRLNLIQRLLSTSSDEARTQIISQEEKLIDENFISMSNKLLEAAIENKDERSTKELAILQKKLLETTPIGMKIQAQAKETETAIKSLQEASKKGLTREKLLELMINAPSEIQLNTLVGVAHKGLDYQFFELITKRIDKSSGEKQQALIQLREKLLNLTHEINEELKKRVEAAQQNLEMLLKTKDIKEATTKVLPEIDEPFLEALHIEIDAAREKGDLERSSKLQEVLGVIEEASNPPPEFQLIQEMLETPDENALRKVLDAHREEINNDFLQVMSSLINQSETSKEDPKVIQKLQIVYRAALRFSMELNLK